MSTSQPDELAQREVVTDLKAAVGARRELSPELEDHVLEAFLARVEHRIDARVAQQVAATVASQPAASKKSKDGGDATIGVVAGSLALAIPLMAIAGNVAQATGMIIVMVGVVLVNLLYFIDRWR